MIVDIYDEIDISSAEEDQCLFEAKIQAELSEVMRDALQGDPHLAAPEMLDVLQDHTADFKRALNAGQKADLLAWAQALCDA